MNKEVFYKTLYQTLRLLPILLLMGCHRGQGVNTNAIKVGMTGEQVRAACGEPLIVSHFAPTYNNVVTKTEDVWNYRSDDAIVEVSLLNDKVTKVNTRQDRLKAAEKKIHVGMTDAEVTSAIGQPQQHFETVNYESLKAGHPRKVQSWMYTDGSNSANILLVEVDAGKVSKVTLTENAIYNSGGGRNGNLNMPNMGR